MHTLHIMADNIQIFWNMEKDWSIHGRLFWFSTLIILEGVYFAACAYIKKC